jgi:signal transduction histidine kinase
MATSMLKLELDRARQSLVERNVVMSRLFDSHEAERRQLATELHEECAQAMAAVLLGLRALESETDPERARTRLAALRGYVEETLHNLRQLAVSLRPPVLDVMGLVPALERLTDVHVDAGGLGDERLPEHVETLAYRAVEQALAWLDPPVQVRLAIVLDSLEITITGDPSGQGSELFWAIRARLELMGGTLRFEDGLVTCQIPLGQRLMLLAGGE